MSEKRKPALVELISTSIDQVAWEASRLPDSLVKMLSFRDGVVFSLAKLKPGSKPTVQNDKYRQIRYVVEGEFVVNGTTYGPGTTIDIPEDTNFTVSSPSGGQWFVLEMACKSPETHPTDPRITSAA